MRKSDTWQTRMYDETFARATIASKAYARIADVEAKFLIKAMGLAPGESLLDVPCGTGRHARVFADHGVNVTGIDINPGLVRLAKRAHPSERLAFKTGNMAKLAPYRGKFDAVVNLFTSFGYFASEAANVAVLRGMIGTLRPGGRLAIHLIDRNWLLSRFEANSWNERAGVFTLDARRYDPRTKRIVSQTVILDRKSGRARAYSHQTRLYTKPEMVRMLRDAGLKRVQVYGDTDGSLYRKGESSHPIYIGWR